MSTLTAISPLAPLGVAEESTSAGYGVPQTVSNWIPFTSDTLKKDQPQRENEAIFNNSDIQDSVEGLIAAGGGIVVPVFGQTSFGFLLKWLTRAFTSASFPYAVATAPTLASTTGTLTGSFFYAVLKVLQETATGLLFATVCSPTSSVISLTAQGATVTWVNPSASNLPIGFTDAGAIILRTAASGVAGSETAYDYLPTPSATSYTDNGTPTGTGGTSGQGRVNVVNRHLFSPSNNQPRSFTIEAVRNNGSSEQYQGCMMNSMSLPIKPADVLTASFDVFAQDMQVITSTTPSVSSSPAFAAFKSTTLVATQGGTLAYNALVTETTVSVNNGLNRRYNLTGQAFLRKIKATLRKVTGEATLEFEDTTQLAYFLNQQAMALYSNSRGGGTTPGWQFVITVSGTKYTINSWPFMLTTDLPNVKYNGHQGNANTKNPIIQKLPWLARGDATKGYACQFGLYNTASTTAYNDAS